MTQFIILPKRAKDITDQRFGRLVALGPVDRTSNNSIIWLCRCTCGNMTETTTAHLRSGHTQSCGCYKRDTTVARHTTHHKSSTNIYRAWSMIKQRCINPDNRFYVHYGGRGITICQEWMNSFQTFYDHVSQLPHFDEDGYSLDRIDNDGPYAPGNVRWSNDVAQANNRRIRLDAVMLTHNNKTQGLTAWSKETGINRNTISNRFCRGWTTERILTTPAGPYYGRKRK